ncbi:murein biosynthesis integral membrane protein MurJ [Desulfotignum phosphitoxidans]|uniref:Probable lipid II flippase MurJ n=1 Tax=Desulfotignum phosphitoxidans DSM 13687 TaxID=1286635 RepID=S0G7E2_9BACT|nr:murein biosynthesis integral membrane protein MurJ [Desulfotignum phosphitoxidans]EMS80811.1 30S ribosomal protein S20 [Desulfotignum phosphitoxidans DSM 13687]
MALIKHTAAITGLTLLSRIFGVIRDAFIAMMIGTTAASDAFFIAFRPFDLLRKMFSDGIFSISFVPPFSRSIQTGQQDEAVTMVTSAFGVLSALSAFLILAGWLLAPWLLHFMAPGFAPGGDRFALTLTLFKIMMPYLWVIMMISLCMAVLNTLGQFCVPGATPLVFNLVVIAFALTVPKQVFDPVIWLAVGVMAGGGIQLMFQIPFMVPYQLFQPARFVWCHPPVMDSIKNMVPCMVGAAPYQINMLVISFLASFLVDGSVSFLYYADRLVQFPVALIAVSISTVLLPFFSRKAAAGDIKDISDVFDAGVRLAVFVAVPAMAGLMVLREPIVRLLFGQGAFDTAAVIKTAECLWYLALGIGAFIGTRLFVTLHYALNSSRDPFYAGIISMTTNLVCAPLLMYYMGARGLALAVTMSSMAGFFFLMTRPLAGVVVSKTGILVSACRAFFLSVIMIISIQWVKQHLFFDTQGKLLLGIKVMACVLLGMAIVWIGAKLLHLPELSMIGHRLDDHLKKKDSHGAH